jgi:hypothetical protein
MRIAILALTAAAILFGQDKDAKQSKDASKSEPAKGTPAEPPRSALIPKEAIRVEPNLYRYVDAQGKTWFYRQLPFGVSKYEDKPQEPALAEQPAVVLRDLGDSVEFQRKTPFGTARWVTKKTDLTEEQKKALAADEAKRAAASKDTEKTDPDKKESGKARPVDKSGDKQEKQ